MNVNGHEFLHADRADELDVGTVPREIFGRDLESVSLIRDQESRARSLQRPHILRRLAVASGVVDRHDDPTNDIFWDEESHEALFSEKLGQSIRDAFIACFDRL